ncbi:MAG TPA: alpha/beta fold hydrolase [Chitinophagaceae bacterium]|nr:alpha/beta fold hydrolase [Chitinophagaceae bacterium]
MKEFLVIVLLIICTSFKSLAQTNEKDISIKINNGVLDGTLTTTNNHAVLAIIIAGSGPTDRDGNNIAGVSANTYKMLAAELQKNNIATIRYDKRGVGKSLQKNSSEDSLRFEDYINDAITFYHYAIDSLGYKKIFFIGHSEGSLIAIVAAQQVNVMGVVSISGAGRPIDEVILSQLESKEEVVYQQARDIFTILKNGKTIHDVPKYLYALFRPSVQPYMISWLKYTPADEIKKIKPPVLIINGTCDIQTKPSEAQILYMANTKNKIVLIKKMTHTLKNASDDCEDIGMKTYTDKTLPINEELIINISKFIN